MRASIERRLAALEDELKTGARIVAEQEAALAKTRATLLRIEGAAAVLRELLASPPDHPSSMVGDRPPAEEPSP